MTTSRSSLPEQSRAWLISPQPAAIEGFRVLSNIQPSLLIFLTFDPCLNSRLVIIDCNRQLPGSTPQPFIFFFLLSQLPTFLPFIYFWYIILYSLGYNRGGGSALSCCWGGVLLLALLLLKKRVEREESGERVGSLSLALLLSSSPNGSIAGLSLSAGASRLLPPAVSLALSPRTQHISPAADRERRVAEERSRASTLSLSSLSLFDETALWGS